MGLGPGDLSNSLRIQRRFHKIQEENGWTSKYPLKTKLHSDKAVQFCFLLAIPTPEARLGMLQLLRSVYMVVQVYIPGGKSASSLQGLSLLAKLSEGMMGWAAIYETTQLSLKRPSVNLYWSGVVHAVWSLYMACQHPELSIDQLKP